MVARALQQTEKDVNDIGAATGERVLGVFAFCDIRNFTDATEVL